MTHQIYFRAVIAMSPESLLLNALRCHLVFAGSLWRAGGGRAVGAVWSRAPALLCSTIFREPFACQAQKQWNSGSVLSTLLPKILGRCCRLGMSLPVLREFVWLNRTLVASSGKSRGCWGEAVSWGSSDGKGGPKAGCDTPTPSFGVESSP